MKKICQLGNPPQIWYGASDGKPEGMVRGKIGTSFFFGEGIGVFWLRSLFHSPQWRAWAYECDRAVVKGDFSLKDIINAIANLPISVTVLETTGEDFWFIGFYDIVMRCFMQKLEIPEETLPLLWKLQESIDPSRIFEEDVDDHCGKYRKILRQMKTSRFTQVTELANFLHSVDWGIKEIIDYVRERSFELWQKELIDWGNKVFDQKIESIAAFKKEIKKVLPQGYLKAFHCFDYEDLKHLHVAFLPSGKAWIDVEHHSFQYSSDAFGGILIKTIAPNSTRSDCINILAKEKVNPEIVFRLLISSDKKYMTEKLYNRVACRVWPGESFNQSWLSAVDDVKESLRNKGFENFDKLDDFLSEVFIDEDKLAMQVISKWVPVIENEIDELWKKNHAWKTLKEFIKHLVLDVAPDMCWDTAGLFVEMMKKEALRIGKERFNQDFEDLEQLSEHILKEKKDAGS